MNRRFQSQKGDSTTLSTGHKRWPREKPRKLFIWWYGYICYDGTQYKDFFYMKYLMIKYWWVTSYEFVVRIIYLKGLFPHPNVSKFHLLSYFTPSPSFLFHLRDTLERLLEWRFLEDNGYELFCGTEDFIIIFMVLNIVLENYLRMFCLWWIRVLTFVMRF